MIDEIIKDHLFQFIEDNIHAWRHETLDMMHNEDLGEDNLLCITFATNDGKQWNYQTGDNSFTGNAYGLKHWAVIYISTDSETREVFDDVIEQWEEHLFNEQENEND